MIRATIFHCNDGLAVGFTVKCHGDPIVCSAVSMLAINTLNSIEKLTPLKQADFRAMWNKNGGFIAFALKRPQLRDTGAGILLDSLVLGLHSVCEQYPKDLKIAIRKVM